MNETASKHYASRYLLIESLYLCESGIHAFWKGQGDKETIRITQANIMRQYMDAGADPCHDFYQYACGNWAAMNPIPADKAG